MQLTPIFDRGNWRVEIRDSDGKLWHTTDGYSSVGFALAAAREWCKHNAD